MPSRTLAELALKAARGSPAAAFGGDRETSSALTAVELERRSAQLGAALASYGLEPGERVAMLTEDGAEALLALFAVARAGGTAVPIDPGTRDENLKRLLLGASVRQALVSDEEALARVQRIRPDLPELDLVLLFREPRESRAAALTVAGACEVGAETLAREPGLLEASRGSGARGPVVLRAVAGGEPLLQTDAHLLAAAEAAAGALRIEPGDAVFSGLPATDAAHLALALACLARGIRLEHARPSESAWDAMATCRPTLAVVTRSSAASLGRLLESAAGSGWVGRKLLRFARRQGEKRSAADLAAGHLPAGWTWGWRAAELLVVRRIARVTGGRLSRLLSLGGPLPAPESRHLLALGVPLLEGISSAETAGLVATGRSDALRPGTAGPLVPGLEARTGEGGVLEVRGPMVAAEGWRRVPFRGQLDPDGYLVVAPSR